MKKVLFTVAVSAIFGFNSLLAQEVQLTQVANVAKPVGAETQLWKWTEAAPHHGAVAKIEVANLGNGSAVVVHKFEAKHKGGSYGLVATARHILVSSNKEEDPSAKWNSINTIRIVYANGKAGTKSDCVWSDAKNDVALIYAWIPDEITPAPIAANCSEVSDLVEFAGFGGSSKVLRSFTAPVLSVSTRDKIYADAFLIVGDSGCPVFNESKEVVGVASGGWFWDVERRVISSEGISLPTTWPARATNSEALRNGLPKAKEEVAKKYNVR